MNYRAAIVRRSDGRFLLFFRASDVAVLSSTWEVPWVEAATAAAASEALNERYGGVWRLLAEGARIRHSITYRRLSVTPHQAEVDAPAEWRAKSGWFAPSELGEIAVSSLVRKMIDGAEAVDQSGSAQRSTLAAREDEPADELVVDFAEALGEKSTEDPQ